MAKITVSSGIEIREYANIMRAIDRAMTRESFSSYIRTAIMIANRIPSEVMSSILASKDVDYRTVHPESGDGLEDFLLLIRSYATQGSGAHDERIETVEFEI